ncbi:hypothetical protein EJ06DRAFT_525083 [Trichodelitschia bisporula]|uniref:Uncharacterized protein n=1 Tax=Trichodelitschia bisporula TaxID=703511 RepID=A0A6G1HIF5_9PEZI|nr:hypothetical protein EJ06DRAFT_525083 [Trichodelitschia bisporula]
MPRTTAIAIIRDASTSPLVSERDSIITALLFVRNTDPDVPPTIPSKKNLKSSGKGTIKTSALKKYKAVHKASTAKPKKKLFQAVDAEMAATLGAILPGLPKEF